MNSLVTFDQATEALHARFGEPAVDNATSGEVVWRDHAGVGSIILNRWAGWVWVWLQVDAAPDRCLHEAEWHIDDSAGKPDVTLADLAGRTDAWLTGHGVVIGKRKVGAS